MHGIRVAVELLLLRVASFPINEHSHRVTVERAMNERLT